MPNLAISLHSTTEEQRDRLVPINRKYGLQDLLDACRRFPLKSEIPPRAVQHRALAPFAHTSAGVV